MNTVTKLTNIWVLCLNPLSTKEEVADAIRDLIMEMLLYPNKEE